MKKTLIIFLGLGILLSSCDRKSFVKKLSGTWTLDKYLYAGQNFSTKMKDTVMVNYRLTLDNNQSYLESWESFTYSANFFVVPDTFYNTDGSINFIQYDTTHFVDTAVIPSANSGGWELINSEEDLQLRNAATNDVRIYRILNLSGSQLDMRKGNEEIYLKTL
ncbi:MAG: hypothetical protein IPP77_09065 [Bacteroidetes bacterium]|nr:hypothetical protein [Bacteroidota bacterium]